mmetsp:Transcript_10341/g.24294  ORF Transcript_10341/g.24294 Transcript_10341/m.24294 type:complete len:569 (-) Transcript_10341:346-2052(-)
MPLDHVVEHALEVGEEAGLDRAVRVLAGRTHAQPARVRVRRARLLGGRVRGVGVAVRRERAVARDVHEGRGGDDPLDAGERGQAEVGRLEGRGRRLRLDLRRRWLDLALAPPLHLAAGRLRRAHRQRPRERDVAARRAAVPPSRRRRRRLFRRRGLSGGVLGGAHRRQVVLLGGGGGDGGGGGRAGRGGGGGGAGASAQRRGAAAGGRGAEGVGAAAQPVVVQRRVGEALRLRPEPLELRRHLVLVAAAHERSHLEEREAGGDAALQQHRRAVERAPRARGHAELGEQLLLGLDVEVGHVGGVARAQGHLHLRPREPTPVEPVHLGQRGEAAAVVDGHELARRPRAVALLAVNHEQVGVVPVRVEQPHVEDGDLVHLVHGEGGGAAVGGRVVVLHPRLQRADLGAVARERQHRVDVQRRVAPLDLQRARHRGEAAPVEPEGQHLADVRVARRDVRVDARLPHLARQPPRVVGRERLLVPRLEGRDRPLLRVAQQVGPSAPLERELRRESDLQPLLRARQQLLAGGTRSVGANPPRVQVGAGVKIVRVLHLEPKRERPRRAPLAARTIP